MTLIIISLVAGIVIPPGGGITICNTDATGTCAPVFTSLKRTAATRGLIKSCW